MIYYWILILMTNPINGFFTRKSDTDEIIPEKTCRETMTYIYIYTWLYERPLESTVYLKQDGRTHRSILCCSLSKLREHDSFDRERIDWNFIRHQLIIHTGCRSKWCILSLSIKIPVIKLFFGQRKQLQSIFRWQEGHRRMKVELGSENGDLRVPPSDSRW